MVTWGAGNYGQLGDGFAWDNPRPQIVPNVKNVISMSAGMRHSVVAAGVGGIGTTHNCYFASAVNIIT